VTAPSVRNRRAHQEDPAGSATLCGVAAPPDAVEPASLTGRYARLGDPYEIDRPSVHSHERWMS
jgi:hypothetical protein